MLDTKENVTKPIPENVRQVVRDIFEEPYVIPIMVDTARAVEARELRWDYPWLRTPDAIHIASAIYSKVDEMHTYDGQGNKRGILDLNPNPPMDRDGRREDSGRG